MNLEPRSDQTSDGSQPHPWTDLAVPIGLGTNTFGRTTDEASSRAVLDAFADSGGTLLDTSDTYSDGASETIIGGWLRDRGTRDDVILVTKVGNHPDFEGLSRASVFGGVQESLRRLGVDHIDVYFAHYEDEHTPVQESAAAFDELRRDGRIGAIGLSNFSAETVQAWIDVARQEGYATPVALQPHYSLIHRRTFEPGLARIAERKDWPCCPTAPWAAVSYPASTALGPIPTAALGAQACCRC